MVETVEVTQVETPLAYNRRMYPETVARIEALMKRIRTGDN